MKIYEIIYINPAYGRPLNLLRCAYCRGRCREKYQGCTEKRKQAQSVERQSACYSVLFHNKLNRGISITTIKL